LKNKIQISAESSINKFKLKDWNECNKNGNVFLSYNFLKLLEDSKSIGDNTGWQPVYFCLKTNNKITIIVPSFIKYHSQGEFVFDHSWAQAYQSLGLKYYPKLLIASPFSPVTGKRILMTQNANDPIKKKLFNFIKDFCKEKEISSIHINFFEEHELDFLKNEGFLIRYGEQFHFINKNYNTFEDYLKKLSYKIRKNISKERKSIKDQGIDIEIVKNEEFNESLSKIMYKFYISTIEKKWSYNYLTKDFFIKLPQYLNKESILILAKKNKNIIAGALNFISNNILYGRYWGSNADIKNLHFEVCYYQAMELAIKNKYIKVEAGAQGAHKIKRGYLPKITYSAHYIFNEKLRLAIKNFLAEERKIVLNDINYINDNYSPFKTI
jgi:predicted N-acyltransferase